MSDFFDVIMNDLIGCIVKRSLHCQFIQIKLLQKKKIIQIKFIVDNIYFFVI